MKIKNNEIMDLIHFLGELELKAKASRMRTRFCKVLNVYVEDVFNPERLEIINKYAELDADGNPVILDGQRVSIKEDQIEAFNEEMGELLSECFVLDVTESNLDMLTAVADAILEYDGTLSGLQALLYDEWCEEFEKVKEIRFY